MPAEREQSVLDKIVSARRAALKETRSAVPLAHVQQVAESRQERRDFASALAPGAGQRPSAGLQVIAELKHASPSRGILRSDYRPVEIAPAYANAGAAALSVLTEKQHFMGSTPDLAEAREAVTIPVLRKDFILESYQIYESVAVGADALLLIVAALSDAELHELLNLCRELRIAALVEVHTETELKRATQAGAGIIGVNNRNLKTLEVNLETSLELRSKVPRGCLTVSESGIKTAADLQRISQAGFNAVLIGERLMTQRDPGAALAQLLTEFAAQADPVESRSC